MSRPKLTLDEALAHVPKDFKSRLIKCFKLAQERHQQAQYDSSGLSGGKFCECLLRFLQHNLTGKYTPFGIRITNFVDECEKLTRVNKAAGNESLRVLMPRALVLVYSLRGKRGIGHVGGDVDANRVDSSTIVGILDWLMCETVRIFHSLSLEEAQDLVDSLSERKVPWVWDVGGKKRILISGLDFREQTLCLLHACAEQSVIAEDLFDWIEYSNYNVFKKSVLQPLHKKRLLEYDKESGTVSLSPLGIQQAESILREEL
ncbi:MAG: hypothetical protein NT028_07360 [candidate division Zixibacteria bacterium]|nr:hypothetical protein [candidate division Zixibacteria bacterium]